MRYDFCGATREAAGAWRADSMVSRTQFGAAPESDRWCRYSDSDSQILWEDGERVFRRGWWLDDNGQRRAVLIVVPAAEHPSRSGLDRLTHEYELKDQLDGTWAARPLDLVRDSG